MSMLRAAVPRLASRSLAASRRAMSTPAGQFKVDPELAQKFVSERQHAFEHAGKSAELWRKISIYGLLPGSVVLGVYMYKIESEHAKHHEHVLEEHGGLPERPDYEYVNIKTKKFPWGQQSLFYNPKVNYPSPDM
ncbi:Cytochrome c oxidase subunit 6A [Malassezia cuniculi]|uniref:Cytochrome c oxidase subunit 6A n=1 Tax=Malassezia cuniculi TaxID=948313 RepID=A0AAF0ESI1_9BASI|nr:Cytochrome c oxidase subunit 6A [Malassezia cuniculi]